MTTNHIIKYKALIEFDRKERKAIDFKQFKNNVKNEWKDRYVFTFLTALFIFVVFSILIIFLGHMVPLYITLIIYAGLFSMVYISLERVDQNTFNRRKNTGAQNINVSISKNSKIRSSNQTAVYMKKLSHFLKSDLGIINSNQLGILIKSLEREYSQRKKSLNVKSSYIAIGLGALYAIGSKDRTTTSEQLIEVIIYYIVIMTIVHVWLKMLELFINSYADRILTLILYLENLQIELFNSK